jgi:hypothetical protein
MKEVIHQNFFTNNGKIFCKKLNKVIDMDINNCDDCEMCVGSLQGAGVECLWEDEDKHYPIMAVTDPVKEQMRVAKSSDIKKSVRIELRK